MSTTGVRTPVQTRRGGSAMRLRGLIRKEALQIMRDPSSIAIALVMPVVLLFLFGYAVSLDAKDIAVAVVVEDPGPDATAFVGHLDLSPYFRVYPTTSMREAEEAMMARRVDGIVRVRPDFARELRRLGGAPIQVIVNGVDANRGRTIAGYVEGLWGRWLRYRAEEDPANPMPAVQVEQRIWFNDELRSPNFLVPGLIALIMTLTGALLTALVMAREWERGTMEAMLVSPVRVHELLLGKLVPYFILGMGGMTLSVLLAVFLFDVPLRGSLLALGIVSALYLLVALGMGLLISAVTRSQFVAAQVAIIVTYLPAFFLSGFIFDVASMPHVVQVITRVLAARYFVTMLHTLFLAGDVWAVLLPNAAVLALMAVFFLGMTRRKTRKRLE